VPLEDCDRGQVEGALAVPRAGWGDFERYPDLSTKAAALLCTFAKIQPCIDGNKRLTLILTNTFLHLNGVRLATPHGALAEKILDVAVLDSSVREKAIRDTATWIEEHSTRAQ
jgi:death-on-curing protein